VQDPLTQAGKAIDHIRDRPRVTGVGFSEYCARLSKIAVSGDFLDPRSWPSISSHGWSEAGKLGSRGAGRCRQPRTAPAATLSPSNLSV